MEVESKFITQAYEELTNCKVEKEGDKPNVSIIYFTSNALYYPNDDKTVYERIFVDDRYEFRHYRRPSLPGEIKQEIFVRDVYKQWYILGINKEINTVEALADYLKQLTKGTRVITVGSSAGGFAACLFGMLVGAEQIFTFSGQYDVTGSINPGNEVLWEYQDNPNYNQYFSIVNRLKDNTVPVFYFYPSGIDKDLQQNKLVKGIPCIHRFCIQSNEHGRTIYDQNIPFVLAMSPEHLCKLEQKYSGQIISPLRFSAENMKPSVTARAFLYNSTKTAVHVMRKLKRKLHH